MDRTQTFAVFKRRNTGWRSGCSGRPSQVRQTKTWRSCEIVNEKQRSAIYETTGRLGYTYGTCQRILREEVNMRWIIAKFIPRLLTPGNPQKSAAAKTWKWSSILLTRTIWPLVISSCFQTQIRSYEGVVSRMLLKFLNHRRQSNRRFQNVISGGTSSSGTNAAPVAWNWNSSTFKETTLTNNKSIRVFRYRLSPGTSIVYRESLIALKRF